jgi:hypothetical protein
MAGSFNWRVWLPVLAFVAIVVAGQVLECRLRRTRISACGGRGNELAFDG